MEIYLHCEAGSKLSLTSLKEFSVHAHKAAKLRGDVAVIITSNQRMRELNRAFRKKDKPTDVLSFPMDGDKSFCGDIAISRGIASANAKRLGHTLITELKVLILHGMLHLAGYDHETDKGEMARKEDQIRLQLDLPKSLILRGKVSDVGAGRGKKTGSRRKPDRIGKVRAAASARSTRTFREGVLPKGKARPVANR